MRSRAGALSLQVYVLHATEASSRKREKQKRVAVANISADRGSVASSSISWAMSIFPQPVQSKLGHTRSHLSGPYTAGMDTWQLYRNDAGLWCWRYTDADGISTERRWFESRTQCIADAMKHGYVSETNSHSRPAAKD